MHLLAFGLGQAEFDLARGVADGELLAGRKAGIGDAPAFQPDARAAVLFIRAQIGNVFHGYLHALPTGGGRWVWGIRTVGLTASPAAPRSPSAGHRPELSFESRFSIPDT